MLTRGLVVWGAFWCMVLLYLHVRDKLCLLVEFQRLAVNPGTVDERLTVWKLFLKVNGGRAIRARYPNSNPEEVQDTCDGGKTSKEGCPYIMAFQEPQNWTAPKDCEGTQPRKKGEAKF